MLTKSTLSGRRARRLAASMTVVFGAQFAGCVDQPTEPAREVVTAARPNADVVYTAPWYPSEFYEILDENGAKIWQTEADLPLQGGYFTLALPTRHRPVEAPPGTPGTWRPLPT